MSETVAFSQEQFEKLIEAIKPSSLYAPTAPTDEKLCQDLACDILQVVGRTWNPPEGKYPKLIALSKQLKCICKEYL